ncbi:MAG TPA: GspMb/PilO family protein [Phycisphaerae bacterium]|nr:GspMb/PilO family protein [Phycisphaerae bacterium]
MALNKREKNIATILGAVLGGYLVYAYAIDPYLATMDQIKKDQTAATAQLNLAHHLFTNRKSVKDEWDVMIANGLASTPSAAELRVLPEISRWAQNRNVHIDSHKTDAASQTGDFQQMRITITGSGNMSSIWRLLADIETSRLPIQISDCRISSKKADGSDDLSVQLTVNTLIFSPLQSTTKPNDKKPNAAGDAI